MLFTLECATFGSLVTHLNDDETILVLASLLTVPVLLQKLKPKVSRLPISVPIEQLARVPIAHDMRTMHQATHVRTVPVQHKVAHNGIHVIDSFLVQRVPTVGQDDKLVVLGR